jgi:small basic protein
MGFLDAILVSLCLLHLVVAFGLVFSGEPLGRNYYTLKCIIVIGLPVIGTTLLIIYEYFKSRASKINASQHT